MQRSRVRVAWAAKIIVVLTAVAGAGVAGSSCVFASKTTFCEQFGVRCKEGQECAAEQAVCINRGGCGNGVVDPGEVCDDGNIVDGPDDGAGAPDACSHDCSSDQRCGNGIRDVGEECDHGARNGAADETCDVACRILSELCGNTVVDPVKGEQCDPGPADTDKCNAKSVDADLQGASCKVARCGDGYRNAAAREACDSAGMDSANCNGASCTAPRCGDAYVNTAAGEDCEAGGADTSSCNGVNAGMAGCRAPTCGDGYRNAKFAPANDGKFEQCDDEGDSPQCNGNNQGANTQGSCQRPSCGDGYVNPMYTPPGSTAVEACDTPGGADTATCNGNHANAPASCRVPTCGDSYVNPKFKPPGSTKFEACDEGQNDTAMCNGSDAGDAACQPTRCGDGYLNPKSEDCEKTTDCVMNNFCSACQCVPKPGVTQ